MPKRQRKKSDDINILSKYILEKATKETPDQETSEEKPKKNPAAVALGRLGTNYLGLNYKLGFKLKFSGFLVYTQTTPRAGH